MKSLWLVSLLLLFSSLAEAGVLASVGTNLSFNYAADGRSYEIQQPLNLRAGYRFQVFDTLLEYSRYSSADNVGVVNTKLTHEEWVLWGRHIFATPWFVQPYLGAGLGLQSETVKTNFIGSESIDKGTPETMGALSLGLRTIVFERLNLEVEGKASFSRSYAPNPLFGVGIFAGWEF